jgi:hypothetical protein
MKPTTDHTQEINTMSEHSEMIKYLEWRQEQEDYEIRKEEHEQMSDGPRYHIEQALGRTENFIRGCEMGDARGGPTWVMLDAIRTDLKAAIVALDADKGKQD